MADRYYVDADRLCVKIHDSLMGHRVMFHRFVTKLIDGKLVYNPRYKARADRECARLNGIENANNNKEIA